MLTTYEKFDIRNIELHVSLSSRKINFTKEAVSISNSPTKFRDIVGSCRLFNFNVKMNYISLQRARGEESKSGFSSTTMAAAIKSGFA